MKKPLYDKVMEWQIDEADNETLRKRVKFLTHMAYNALTPMTKLREPLSVLAKSEVITENSELQRALREVSVNLAEILEVINEMLDFNNIGEAGFNNQHGALDDARKKDNLASLLQRSNVKIFLSRLSAIIHEHYPDPGFSMKDIYRIMGMSRTSFYRLADGAIDHSPNDCIRNYRLQKAVELFDNGANNISMVCYKVGFSSPAYFTSCFKKVYGMRPKEYIYKVRSTKKVENK